MNNRMLETEEPKQKYKKFDPSKQLSVKQIERLVNVGHPDIMPIGSSKFKNKKSGYFYINYYFMHISTQKFYGITLDSWKPYISSKMKAQKPFEVKRQISYVRCK